MLLRVVDGLMFVDVVHSLDGIGDKDLYFHPTRSNEV